MCNIVTFRFTCQHTLRRRRSRCNGTKHKITAHSIKAACIAESFLTIYLRIDCDSCQHRAWEDAWRLKLERANTFLEKLRQRSLPGVSDVSDLIKSLEAEYAAATWDTRNMFAHGPKPSITRVKQNHYEKAASKLPQEVHPEDVVEKAVKEWEEMGEEDYDGNYKASTDPGHPVSTDYSHPHNDDDEEWILQHLSPEDVEPGVNDAVDLHAHSWRWGDNEGSTELQHATDSWAQQAEHFEEATGIDQTWDNASDGLMAWGPDTHESSYGEIDLKGAKDLTTDRNERVQEIIKAFWSIINDNQHSAKSPSPSSLPTTPDSGTLIDLLDDLALSSNSPTSSDTRSSPPTTPTKPSAQPL